MKTKLLLLFAFTIVCNASFAQIDYQKGYFLSNNGEKTDCFIKNMDWKNNPSEIKYRIGENDEVKTALIEDIGEFLIYDECKFVRAVVEIDRSVDNVNNLSTDVNPLFNKEQLFLRVVIEGNATLYQYQDSNLTRFFYSIGETDKVQLIYKRFLPNGLLTIGRNETYKEQLETTMLCSKITPNSIERLNYEFNPLKKIFLAYNTCVDSNSTMVNGDNSLVDNSSAVYNKNDSQRDVFNLTPRIGANFSSFDVVTVLSGSNDNINYGSKTNLRIGLETEFILPYNKNKIALIAEFTLSNFKSEVNIGNEVRKVDYNSFDIPFGVRYYFFLNESSKIYINAVYNLNVSTGKLVQTKDFDLTPSTSSTLGYGLGYKFKNKFSVEYRLLSSRNASDYIFYNFNYKVSSLILGHSFF
jgi:hypothetical protein